MEQKLSLDYILNNTLWVARFMSGYRIVDTYDKVGKYGADEDCKDVDVLSTEGQPKDLQPFWKDYWEYADNHREFITIQDFYNNIWSKEDA